MDTSALYETINMVAATTQTVTILNNSESTATMIHMVIGQIKNTSAGNGAERKTCLPL